MSSGSVAKRYAKALFDVASANNQLDIVETELEAIQSAFNENPTFLHLLNHPQIDKKVKKEQVQQLFKGKVSDTVLILLSLLIDRNRQEQLAAIGIHFTSLANQARGIEDAIVTSVQPLSDQEKDELTKHFSKIVNKKIRIHNVVDSSILGGLLVRIGDRLYDGSVVGKLNRFKRQVLS